jgi:SAM-dependent methyltransferase
VNNGDLSGLLRCPRCSAAVELADDHARCERGDRFPVVDGIPVLVAESELEADPQYAHQRAYFDAEFAGYEAYRLDAWRRSYLDRLEGAGALGGEGRPLVDVAVGGSGSTVIEAARRGRPAVGCDLSLEGLRVARRFAEAEGVADRTLFVCCSAESLPLASGAFDVALAIAILEHVPADGAALDELARVLAPGGRAWITVPHELRAFSPLLWLPNRLHDRRLGHLRRYSARGLVDAAHARGLEPIDVQFTGHAIKLLQLLVTPRVPAEQGERLWWWAERRDLARAGRRRGSMQLSAAFRRT